jgi:hypothetical protein
LSLSIYQYISSVVCSYGTSENIYAATRIRDSSVGTATDYELDYRVRLPAGTRDFSRLHVVQAVSEAHSAPYQMVIGFSGRGMKLTTHLLLQRSLRVELYLHS